jgi:hypothetical protein
MSAPECAPSAPGALPGRPAIQCACAPRPYRGRTHWAQSQSTRNETTTTALGAHSTAHSALARIRNTLRICRELEESG